MKESDIIFESASGQFWVGKTVNSYTVYRAGATHSKPDSSYTQSRDGLSIAIARCIYLEQRYYPKTQSVEITNETFERQNVTIRKGKKL